MFAFKQTRFPVLIISDVTIIIYDITAALNNMCYSIVSNLIDGLWKSNFIYKYMQNIRNSRRIFILRGLEYSANGAAETKQSVPNSVKATSEKRKDKAQESNGRGGRVDRRRGESSFIIYEAHANIKFSNCKIDAAYVTLSFSRYRCIFVGSYPARPRSSSIVVDDATGLAGPLLVLL